MITAVGVPSLPANSPAASERAKKNWEKACIGVMKSIIKERISTQEALIEKLTWQRICIRIEIAVVKSQGERSAELVALKSAIDQQIELIEVALIVDRMV